MDTIHQLIAPEYIKMQQDIEKRLSMLGLTPDELSRRAYKIIEGGKTIYYLDGVPIVESEISSYDNIITFSVKSL